MLSLSLSLFQEVGLGAKTSAFHQKQQVAGSIPGVNLSKKKKGSKAAHQSWLQDLAKWEFCALGMTFKKY